MRDNASLCRVNARAGRGTRRKLAPVWVFWIFDLAEHLPLFNELSKNSRLTMRALRTVSPPLFALDVALSVKAAWEDWALAHAPPPPDAESDLFAGLRSDSDASDGTFPGLCSDAGSDGSGQGYSDLASDA